jgi:hypothetical protein
METPMALLAPELSIGGLTALLCAIIVMLIPLTIRVFYTSERKHLNVRRAQRPIRTGAQPEQDPEKTETAFPEGHA